MVEFEAVKMLVSSQNLAFGNQMQGATKLDLMMTTDGEIYSSMPRLLEISSFSENSSCGSYSRRYNYWTSHSKFILWKFLTSMAQKLRFHQSADPRTHIMLWYLEKLSALWTKFINTKQKSGPVNELLKNFQESERNEPNVTSFRSRGTTAWWFKTLGQSNQFWWESLHMKEREISVTKRGYKIFF